MKSEPVTAVVDYGAGNLKSVETALRHIGAKFIITRDPKFIGQADKMIFPGVGGAQAAMKNLSETGLKDAIIDFFRKGKPILGICLGCQIVFEHSDEGDTPCLALIKGNVVKFPRRTGYKIPHMGWNIVNPQRDHWIFRGIPDKCSCYFVHSYYPAPSDSKSIIALTDYCVSFSSAVQYENLTALQFHPEKSGENGLRMLSNFIAQ